MPLQLPYSVRCPFLGRFHNDSFLPCLSSSQTLLNSSMSAFALRLRSTFSKSAVLSWSSISLGLSSGILYLLMCDTPLFIFSCCAIVCISPAKSGSSLFRISQKYSAHLLSCSSSLVRTFRSCPWLLLIC